VVSTKNSRAIGEEKIGRTTKRGQKKKRWFKGEVH
jgi:hypothetical protein